MAKGKHSAALFEVIKNTKPNQAAQSLRTPKWWFKGRQTPTETPLPEPSFSEPELVASESPSAPAAPVAPARSSVPRSYSTDSSRSSTVHLDFDKHRKEITLRLRYTTALVSAFGVCVVIGLAYVIGRHISHGPQTAQASVQPNVQQLMKQPPQPGVTDLNRVRNVAHLQGNETPAPPRHLPDPTNNATPRPPAATTLIPSSAETRLPRAIGLNYAIIQTYPPEEAQAAEAARDFLNKNGIPCSIEKTDYVRNPNWVCLVGTAGFTKISSTDYKGYVDNIIRLGEKFPTSHFNQFKPAAYKWKG
jgi:hypothetical protein